MTRITPIILMLLISFAGLASAQTQATAPVVTTIAQDLRLTSSGETSFGTIGNFAHIETIDPTAPTSSQSTAKFTSTSSGSNGVVFTCPTEVTLTGPGSASLIFTPAITAHPSDDQAAAAPKSCSDGFVIALPTVFLWLGGKVTIAANQAPGDYTGAFTLITTYQ